MTDSVRLRRGSSDDSRPAFDLFLAAVGDLSARQGNPWQVDREAFWPRMEPLYAHLAAHADAWWVAEDAASGAMVGYARSIRRGGMLELSEFFVHPERQAAGVGGALLERALPDEAGTLRVIIATTDPAAQARYYRAGTVARFAIASLAGRPHASEPPRDLEALRLGPDADLAPLCAIEAEALEFDRGEEFRWLLAQREGYLYRRHGEPIGFAFVGAHGTGPIAARRPEHQAAILGHVETRAAQLGTDELSLDVPMVNDVAVRHLLERGFRIDRSVMLLMSSRPFGQFDRFIGYSPPFVL